MVSHRQSGITCLNHFRSKTREYTTQIAPPIRVSVGRFASYIFLVSTLPCLRAGGAACHSPPGRFTNSVSGLGWPKSGEPSTFHVNRCIRIDRRSPQPCPACGLAWYKIQFSGGPAGPLVRSVGVWEKLLCPTPNVPLVAVGLKTGVADFVHAAGLVRSAVALAVSIPRV